MIDASGARNGGLLTFAGALVSAWQIAFPEDALIVLARPELARRLLPSRGLTLVPLTGPSPLVTAMRVIRPAIASHYAAPDAFLGLLPVLPPFLSSRVRTGVVLHDLRHELRPEEFSRRERLIRFAAYNSSYKRVDVIFPISERSAADFGCRYPQIRPTSIIVAPPGVEPVPAQDWPLASPTKDGWVLGYAHHSNKRPELLLRAVALQGSLRLFLVGATPEHALRLAKLADNLNVSQRVQIFGSLPDSVYQNLFLRASIVCLTSTHEGSGLPILEGMVRGKAVVITPDAAMREVSGGHALVAAADTPAAVAAELSNACALSTAHLMNARQFAGLRDWKHTVVKMREQLLTYS